MLADGQKIEGVNEFIYCTGYLIDFPWLDPELSVDARAGDYVKNLYHGMFLTKHPRLVILGALENHII